MQQQSIRIAILMDMYERGEELAVERYKEFLQQRRVAQVELMNSFIRENTKL